MITIVDLGVGNIGSVLKALKSIGAEITLTNNPDDIYKSTKIILPGVSTFEAGMAGVKKYNLLNSLQDAALKRKIPFLGICMGMQILASLGEENGSFEGLGFIPGAVVSSLDPKHCPVIPHMGWNNIENIEGNPLLSNLDAKPDFYFVHSYHMTKTPPDAVVNQVNMGNSSPRLLHIKIFLAHNFIQRKVKVMA